MYKKLCVLIVTTMLCGVGVAAEEQGKKGLSVSEWLKSIQKKLEQLVPKKIVPLSTGVAGARGAKEDSQVKLYWKGKKSDETVTEEELKEFKDGIDLAEKGERTAAIKALEKFMAKYPDSALIPDAKKTSDLVKAESVTGKKVEPKAEKKEEKKEDKKGEAK